jgi:hypothetical protein
VPTRPLLADWNKSGAHELIGSFTTSVEELTRKYVRQGSTVTPHTPSGSLVCVTVCDVALEVSSCPLPSALCTLPCFVVPVSLVHARCG